MDSNCFALLELLSTAQRTEAQLFAMKYVSVKQSIFIKSCKPRQDCSKCSKSSERCTRRAARVRAKVRVLNLTTLLTLGSIILKSVDSNCFALLELLSTAHRTEALYFLLHVCKLVLQFLDRFGWHRCVSPCDCLSTCA